MKQALQEKLTNKEDYTQAELQWLLDHIGDSNPKIRDELVYLSFGHALFEQRIKSFDFDWLIKKAADLQLLSNPSSLTRSFSALFWALVLEVDNLTDSPYHLHATQREKLFSSALASLTREEDVRGYDDQIGWIHTIAHGGELLLAANLHAKAPSHYAEQSWETVLAVFKRQKQVFTAGEAERLALIFIQSVLTEKIQPQELSNWVTQTDFPHLDNQDYLSWLNYQHFLMKLYIELDKEDKCIPTLKTAILSALEE